jgi:hypothetical protein
LTIQQDHAKIKRKGRRKDRRKERKGREKKERAKHGEFFRSNKSRGW